MQAQISDVAWVTDSCRGGRGDERIESERRSRDMHRIELKEQKEKMLVDCGDDLAR